MPAPSCPCGGVSLKTCCGPFLAGEREPPDAAALMRSRYTAFATGRVEHLLRTLHPDHPDRGLPAAQLRLSLSRTCRTTRFRGLEVRAVTEPDSDGVATVTFAANMFQAGRDVSFEERSEFRHDGVGWRYWRGEARPTTSV